MPVLLVGCGSIGQRHLTYLQASRNSDITVVDPAWRTKALGSTDNVTWLEDLSQISEKQLASFDYAIVATHGPSHFDLANQLAFSDIKKLIVEKPLTTSIAKVRQLLSKDFPSKIWINYTLRYSGIVSRLLSEASISDLGACLSLHVFGGAKCLATNGVHYLDLACQLWGNPSRALGLVRNSPINPRGDHLLFLEGVVTAEFATAKYSTIAFSNGSHAPADVNVVFERGEISWTDPKNARVVRRQNTNDESGPTRSKAIELERLTSLVAYDPIERLHQFVSEGRLHDESDPGLELLLQVMTKEFEGTAQPENSSFSIS